MIAVGLPSKEYSLRVIILFARVWYTRLSDRISVSIVKAKIILIMNAVINIAAKYFLSFDDNSFS